MYELGNKFWKVGTNPDKYFNNFIQYVSHLNIGSKIIISDDFTKIIIDELVTFDCNSPATTRQNLACWESFGFVIKISKYEYVKIIDRDYSKDRLFELAKQTLFIESIDETINLYRRSIIIKCLYLITNNNNICDVYNITKRKGENTSYIDIKDECGKFEKKLIEDEKFIKIIRIFYEK